MRLDLETTRYWEEEDAHATLAVRTWLSAPVFRRLEALRLSCLSPPSVVLQALTQEAPDLQSLEVSLGVTTNLQLPGHLLNSNIPRQLRKLSLSGCSRIFYSRLLVETLVHLELKLDHQPSLSNDFTTAHILHALSFMSTLETLFLSGAPRPGHPDEIALLKVKLQSGDCLMASSHVLTLRVSAFIIIHKQSALPDFINIRELVLYRTTKWARQKRGQT